jgi:hypothetical protein
MIYSVVHNLAINFSTSIVFANESRNMLSLKQPATSNLHPLTIIENPYTVRVIYTL